MQTTRMPAVSGQFYPANPQQLQAMVRHYLAAAHTKHYPLPKALIAPHAGYIYSGSTAGEAYACFQQARDNIRRVILLGPSHFVPLSGLALPSVTYFETPLGSIPIDDAMRQAALAIPGIQLSDMAHQREHSLEVHLPFLQMLFPDIHILPIVAGHCEPTIISKLLTLVAHQSDTLIVISSDLSHYHPYETAQQLDKATSESILNLNPDTLHSHGACGAVPIRGLLTFAKTQQWTSTLLALCNSGDTAGSKDRVVGYGAYHFYTQDTPAKDASC